MTPAPLDTQAIANIRALGGDEGDDFLREIVGIFLEDTPLRINELDEALIAGDRAKFARAAHTIKGSSSNVGAVGLSSEAETLERKSRDNLDGAAQAVERLRQEFERTKQALNELIG
jgi:HPt (histidine-containing phosphotransfer) domain-containing protein